MNRRRRRKKHPKSLVGARLKPFFNSLKILLSLFVFTFIIFFSLKKSLCTLCVRGYCRKLNPAKVILVHLPEPNGPIIIGPSQDGSRHVPPQPPGEAPIDIFDDIPSVDGIAITVYLELPHDECVTGDRRQEVVAPTRIRGPSDVDDVLRVAEHFCDGFPATPRVVPHDPDCVPLPTADSKHLFCERRVAPRKARVSAFPGVLDGAYQTPLSKVEEVVTGEYLHPPSRSAHCKDETVVRWPKPDRRYVLVLVGLDVLVQPPGLLVVRVVLLDEYNVVEGGNSDELPEFGWCPCDVRNGPAGALPCRAYPPLGVHPVPHLYVRIG